MENKIPTAEEFLKQETSQHQFSYTHSLIKFAKLHVKAALEAAVDAGDVYQTDNGYIVRSSEKQILKAYPESNIK